ncbi:hypothetical protein OB2597_01567 [Pseudooceanicola batsensis HTCC2597]|uniref:Uncharacterized protein n=1 Tax=Pseudooceanicola batsensis (strain ATCC BAA-863 / DSM 15984 / KCTC 12145 / HTCC2597) TaxID=252305 RepID=A3U306_PSEBH|nr:hypothetical protein [Pseudooceanicola batsensis]EAQ01536.1 hypothetical protein OB2597_01567 [Pseudooceanicola batsensis HTCC2597]
MSWTLPVPFALWQGLAALAERLPSAPITRAQVALMRGGNTASPDLPGLTDLGITPRDIIADLERRGRVDQPGPDDTGR